MSHRQGLHSDDSPYPGEPLCYCDEKTPTTSTPTDLDNSIIGCCGGGLNRHEVCSHVKDYIQAEIVKARTDEAADIHKMGFDILMEKGAASVVVGGTELDKLLNQIERKYGKDIILHVAGSHNSTALKEGLKG